MVDVQIFIMNGFEGRQSCDAFARYFALQCSGDLSLRERERDRQTWVRFWRDSATLSSIIAWRSFSCLFMTWRCQDVRWDSICHAGPVARLLHALVAMGWGRGFSASLCGVLYFHFSFARQGIFPASLAKSKLHRSGIQVQSQ